jgi:hypothetical protein
MNESIENFDIEAAKERVTQIEQVIAELRGHRINSVSAITEDNKIQDDSGTEAADDQASLGMIRQQIEQLEREKTELEAKIKQSQS